MRRTWQIGPYRDEQGQLYPLDPHELDREMVALGVMLSRIGGSAVVAPLRVKADDEYATVGLAVKYDSGNVPAVDAPKQEPLAHEEQPDNEMANIAIEDEPTPEPEPALAE